MFPVYHENMYSVESQTLTQAQDHEESTTVGYSHKNPGEGTDHTAKTFMLS